MPVAILSLEQALLGLIMETGWNHAVPGEYL